MGSAAGVGPWVPGDRASFIRLEVQKPETNERTKIRELQSTLMRTYLEVSLYTLCLRLDPLQTATGETIDSQQETYDPCHTIGNWNW